MYVDRKWLQKRPEEIRALRFNNGWKKGEDNSFKHKKHCLWYTVKYHALRILHLLWTHSIAVQQYSRKIKLKRLENRWHVKWMMPNMRKILWLLTSEEKQTSLFYFIVCTTLSYLCGHCRVGVNREIESVAKIYCW